MGRDTATDREKLKNLLTEFGVGFEEDDNCVTCETGHAKVGGYIGFFTVFEFDHDGNFVSIGVGE